MSASTAREISEYSICRSATGCTADDEARERLELLRVLGVEEFPMEAAGTPEQ
ncbi:hypothetical protein [Streptomyces sp. NBC_00887]|uniref:hypothetical protein n=1 Tax=Streptomyces sp. NBC_00887 TaxID=2975859 RepID=UPI00386E60B4|nr:hypothetical protein OG844_02970 [Streptomyces sp. NBC_00887]WSY36889.1 hypothetical protein OG844_42630 [Streptomyces sp. NBC_00887]